MPTTSPKQALCRLAEPLDDDASFEDIQYELYALQKIERGMRDVEAGRTVSHEEARTRFSPWLDSASGDRG